MNFLKKIGGILLIFGIGFAFLLVPDLGVLLSEPVDIYVDEPASVDELKAGMAIETEVDLLLDKFLTVETDHVSRSQQVYKTEVDKYYTMPVFIGDETYFVAMKVEAYSKDSLKFMNMVEEYVGQYTLTRDTVGGDPVAISGGLYKLKDEYYEYMTDWFKDEKWFAKDSDIEKYVLPLVFKPVIEENIQRILMASGGAIGLGLILLLIGILGSKKRKAKVN